MNLFRHMCDESLSLTAKARSFEGDLLSSAEGTTYRQGREHFSDQKKKELPGRRWSGEGGEEAAHAGRSPCAKYRITGSMPSPPSPAFRIL